MNILYKEIERAVNKWHYLFFILITIATQEYFFLSMIPMLFLISRFIYSINNTLNDVVIKYSILLEKGNIAYTEINSVDKIEFPIMFEVFGIKKYKYCNSNRFSDIEFGILLRLNNGQVITLPTRNPEKLKTLIEQKISLNTNNN